MTRNDITGDRLYHELDDDACCIHCDFDGAEAHAIRSAIHPDDREPRPDCEIYCEARERNQRTKGWRSVGKTSQCADCNGTRKVGGKPCAVCCPTDDGPEGVNEP